MEPPPNFRVRRTGDFWGCLERLEAPDEIFFLTDTVASIGRATSCTVRVTSRKVSRLHCSIHFDSHACAHLDDSSAKGTLINGSFLVKNDSCDLRSGDELILTSGGNGARPIGFRFFLLANVEGFTVSPHVPRPMEPVPTSRTAVAKRSRSTMDEDGPSSGGPNPKRPKGSSRAAAAPCHDIDSNMPGPSSAVFDPNRPGPSSVVVDMNETDPSSGAVDTNRPGASSNPDVPGASGLHMRERTPDAVVDENVEPVIVRVGRQRRRSSSSDRAQALPTVITVEDEEFVMSNESFESRLRKKMEQEKRISVAFQASGSGMPRTSTAVRDFTGGPLADQFPYLETLPREEGEKRLLSVLSSVSDFVSCCICMEYAHDPVTSTNCLHSFCGSCLSKWLFTTDEAGSTRMNCPMCRREISHVTRNAGLASMAAELTNLKPDSERRTGEEVAQRNTENKFIDPNTNMYDVSSMRRAIAFAEISSRQAAARATRLRLVGASGRRGRAGRINDVSFSITVDLDSPNAPAVPSIRRGRGRPTISSRAIATSSGALASSGGSLASSSGATAGSSRGTGSSSRRGALSSRGGASLSRRGTLSTRGGTSSTRVGTSSTRRGTSSTSGGALSTRGGTSSTRRGTSSTSGGTSSTSGGTSSTRGGTSSTGGGVSPTATWRNELSRIVNTMGLFS